MQSVAIFNPQPQVGKTTLCANLGHALALAGKQITVIDFDPAGVLSSNLGLFRSPGQGIDQVLLERVSMEAVSISTRDEMYLIPAGNLLSDIASGSSSDMEKGLLLHRILSTTSSERDYLIFDCPSASDLLVANALLAVDQVLIPVTGDQQGADSMPYLLETIARFSKVRGRPLDYSVVMNRISVKRRLTGVSVSKFSGLAPDHFIRSVICESSQLSEAQKMGRTVFEYRPNCRAAADFSQLAKEFIGRGARS
ncbi:MAG: ParA family protein [Sedimenticola sp.]|uniref:ParA family protein n=1 Tax=Sedimenticola thiotaurini TaxID=1543721 RepID=A0A558DCZ6_9GAMM|nr:ParA family protein [Sedimenticola sp.]MCW8946461.1 ParA family protein [Sedimenticola sp.]MCW8974389.1 ParA family protein [Sedimenticola sp.]TVT58902.1 MAG: ParA family protein [Sedimenticola thiotaurini]